MKHLGPDAVTISDQLHPFGMRGIAAECPLARETRLPRVVTGPFDHSFIAGLGLAGTIQRGPYYRGPFSQSTGQIPSRSSKGAAGRFPGGILVFGNGFLDRAFKAGLSPPPNLPKPLFP